MEDAFAIFYNCKLLVVLTGFGRFGGGVLPEPKTVLDWYAANYAFGRNLLSGAYVQSVSVAGMKLQQFPARIFPHEPA